MPSRSQTFHINNDVFQWLRESSGWTLEEVGNLLNVSVDWVLKWESGEEKPTLLEIKKLAKGYKRPLAAFFLSTPEKDPPLPQDFRRLTGKLQPLSRKTILAIRKARNLQKISIGLLENLEEKTNPEVLQAKIEDDSEEIARIERDSFGFSIENQYDWKHSHEAFNNWRAAIEKRNIRVFQFPMELDELRGFVLMDSEPFTIVLNSSDSVEARSFTLLHEYGHILIREPALCTPENPLVDNSHGAHVESWCNKFSAAFLIPEKNLKTDFPKYGIKRYHSIANRYKVSFSSILTRLVSLHLITQGQYQNEMSLLRQKEAEHDEQSGGRGETLAQRARREKGDVFISLVLDNSTQGHITHSEALDYLGIKTENLHELIKKAS